MCGDQARVPCFEIQAQLDDTAVRLAAQEAALRGSQQRQQLASLRAQLNALQHAPISSPTTIPAKHATPAPTQHAGVAMGCNAEAFSQCLQ